MNIVSRAPAEMTAAQLALATSLQLTAALQLYRFSGCESSYLLVSGSHSLLVDCHSPHLHLQLRERKLPLPELILHTHVQPEHCCEGESFPEAVIRVPLGDETLAAAPEQYRQIADDIWSDRETWSETLGETPYGVAGGITWRPPRIPLRLGPSLTPGEVIVWHDCELTVIALPGHGKHAIGLLLQHAGRPLALFCGDLLRAPGVLVNLYDLERRYMHVDLELMPPLLRRAAGQGVDLFLPATGGPIAHGRACAEALATRIEAYLAARDWDSGTYQPAPAIDYPLIGQYRRIHEGVYQYQRPGSPIVFIDAQGRGMMVDPGPCEYHKPEDQRRSDFIASLQPLHEHCGLRKLELLLITHMHGDHFDFAQLLVDRYGCRVAADEIVARVIESPWDYPYAGLLPWYGLPEKRVTVDDHLQPQTPYWWHDVCLHNLRLPGHCYAHGGWHLTFNGKRFALTGDTVQSSGESATLEFIMVNHSAPGKRGNETTFRTLAALDIDINLGAHGTHFTNCRAMYEESLRRIGHAQPYLAALVLDGELERACTRPWYPPL